MIDDVARGIHSAAFAVAYVALRSFMLALDHLGPGASVALLGGAALYLLSLVGTRTVTVSRSRLLGVSLKLGAAAVILGLLSAEELFPPVAVAAGLAFVLGAVVFLERTLFPPEPANS